MRCVRSTNIFVCFSFKGEASSEKKKEVVDGTEQSERDFELKQTSKLHVASLKIRETSRCCYQLQ